MFLDDCVDNSNQWLLATNLMNQGFTLDYGCEMLVTKINLKNTNHNDR